MTQPFDVCQTPIEPGLTLLEAGAGTGKTYSLVRIIARHLVEQDLKIDQILTVTFTRAATAEIKTRLHQLLSEILESLKNPDLPADKTNDLVAHWRNSESPEFIDQATLNISTALASFDSVAIFTIDGFFQRLLSEFAFQANTLFSVELDTDEQALIQTALRDYWRQHVYSLNQFELSSLMSQIKLEDASQFITEALRTPHATFDPLYDRSATGMLDAYKTQWDHFSSLLEQHWSELIQFVQNPDDALKKSGYPFFKAGAPMTEVLESVRGTAPRLNLKNLERLSLSHLSSDSILKKGKSFDPADSPLAELFRSIDGLKEALPHGLKSAYLGDILRFTRTRLDELKKERNVQSYSDVTQTLSDVFGQNNPTADSMKEAIRQRYRAGLIDEFQDTSPQQCSVFLNLFHNPELFFHIIGDPKQSIYRFRGADVFSYIQASEEANHIYELQTNYRSSPRMIHAVNEVFGFSEDPFLVNKKISFTPASWEDQGDNTTPDSGSSSLFLHTYSSNIKRAPQVKKATQRHIATEILNLLGTPWSTIDPDKKGLITPSDIAILTRSAKEGEAIYRELNQLEIPATLNSRSSLLESRETRELFDILSAIQEPRKPDLLRTALLTHPLGSGKFLTCQYEAEFDRITNDIASFHQQWQRHGLMPMMLEWVRHFDVRTTLLGLDQGRRKITNFMHIIEVLDEKARQEKLTPSATLQWLEMATQGSIIDVDSEILELRIATDDAAVQIQTQHTSKGLEFNIVFATCPCQPDLTYATPSLSYHDPDTLELQFAATEDKDSETYQQRKLETYADASRLAYVSLTRSKYLCHFYISPQSKSKPEEHAVFQMLGISDETDLPPLAENSSGCVSLDAIDANIIDQKLTPWEPQQKDDVELKQPLTTRDINRVSITKNQRTTSFTGITRNTPELAHDSDSEITPVDIPTSTTDADARPESDYWSQLQAGASLGLVFHETLERIDFPNASGNHSLIEHQLKKYSPWKEQPSPKKLSQMVESIESDLCELMRHNLSKGVSLDQISLAQRITEPEFLLSGSHFSVHSLSQIFAQSPPTTVPSYYPEQLKSLPANHFEGFLIGFIDLIFEHNGRYHLLDWKTNRLPSYSQEALADAMAHHHYYLQYHLYTLALDRFLQLRLGDQYDPAKHLGNIYYVFLRGVDPEVPGSGVFFDQFTPERLQKLRSTYQPSTLPAARI